MWCILECWLDESRSELKHGSTQQVPFFCDASALPEPSCLWAILIADSGELVPWPLQILPGSQPYTVLGSLTTADPLI